LQFNVSPKRSEPHTDAVESCHYARGALAAVRPLAYSQDFAAPVIRDETNGGPMFLTRAELGT